MAAEGPAKSEGEETACAARQPGPWGQLLEHHHRAAEPAGPQQPAEEEAAEPAAADATAALALGWAAVGWEGVLGLGTGRCAAGRTGSEAGEGGWRRHGGPNHSPVARQWDPEEAAPEAAAEGPSSTAQARGPVRRQLAGGHKGGRPWAAGH